MRKILLLVLAVSMASMTSCKSKYPNLEEGLYAEIVTNKGTIVAKLYHEATPLTVANFIELAEGKHPMVDSSFAEKPFYNGLTFHRVMKDFMIQGGDPKADGMGSPGYRFPDEFVDSLKHDRKGILSMANPGANANGSQFFITLAETPWLNNKHSIFGEVVIGQEVVDNISLVDVDPGNNKPVDPIVIQEVNIINKGVKAPDFTTEMERLEEKIKQREEELAKVAEETAARLNDLKAEAEEMDSGLKVYWKQKGKGMKPEDGSKIRMNYAGYLANGQLFDSCILEVAEKYDMVNQERLARGMYSPTVSDYGKEARLIPGFREGLNMMSVGDQVILFIPPHLAYGEQGIPNLIPPNSELIFELELVDIFNPE